MKNTCLSYSKQPWATDRRRPTRGDPRPDDAIGQYREHLEAGGAVLPPQGDVDVDAELQGLADILLTPLAPLLAQGKPVAVVGHAELHLVPFWTGDMNLECYEGAHATMSVLAFSGIFVWCFGVTVLIFCRLYCLGDRRMTDESMRLYGFFFSGHGYCYWYGSS